jgi:hypothetical protein
VAVEPDLRLLAHPRSEFDQSHVVAADIVDHAEAHLFGDPDLRFDDVDVRHHLGDLVLDLDPRVDLDEMEAPAVEPGRSQPSRPGTASVWRACFPGERVCVEMPRSRLPTRGARALPLRCGA